MTFPDIEEDPELMSRVEASLQPHHVREILCYTGLYQLVHECIKHNVLQAVRNHFERDWVERMEEHDPDAYRREVLAYDRNVFKASLKWLVAKEAITERQSRRLDEIRTQRHELTHELHRFITDINRSPDRQLFIDALVIVRALDNFWNRVMFNFYSADDLEGVEVEGVHTGWSMTLDLAVRAYMEEYIPDAREPGVQT